MYLGVLIIFFPFVTILVMVHSINFCKNMSTNERFSKRNDGDNKSELTKSISENFQNETLNDEGSILRTTFIGPSNAG